MNLYKPIHFFNPKSCIKNADWEPDEEFPGVTMFLKCQKCGEYLAYVYIVDEKPYIIVFPEFEIYIDEIKENYHKRYPTEDPDKTAEGRKWRDDIWRREWESEFLLDLEPREDDILPLQDNGGDINEDGEGENPD